MSRITNNCVVISKNVKRSWYISGSIYWTDIEWFVKEQNLFHTDSPYDLRINCIIWGQIPRHKSKCLNYLLQPNNNFNCFSCFILFLLLTFFAFLCCVSFSSFGIQPYCQMSKWNMAHRTDFDNGSVIVTWLLKQKPAIDLWSLLSGIL